MLRPTSFARRTNENGAYGVYECGWLSRCVRVSSAPDASNSSIDHGLFTMRTVPNALLYVTALSLCVICHDASLATGPASIIDGAPSMTAGGRFRVLNRNRSVLGVTNEMSNGSAGSRSYSVPGNSVAVPRE